MAHGHPVRVLLHREVIQVVEQLWVIFAVLRVTYYLGGGQESLLTHCFRFGFLFHDPAFSGGTDWRANEDWLDSFVLAWGLQRFFFRLHCAKIGLQYVELG